MQHIAIDLGSKESQICIRAEQGEILHEGKVLTSSLDRYLKRQPQSRVILESCAEAFRIADFALSNEHEVRVVPALPWSEAWAVVLGASRPIVAMPKCSAKCLVESTCHRCTFRPTWRVIVAVCAEYAKHWSKHALRSFVA